MKRMPPSVMSRPGADTRTWLTFGVVLELGYDPVAVAGLTGGVFADVQFQPSGDIETCYVGLPYAGGGFGAWWPLEVNDTVIVAVPMGDNGYGPVIISRIWNSGDLPPPGTDPDWAPGAPAHEPPTDAVIRMKPGSAYKLRGSGADIDIRVEGTGDVIIENLGTGKVKLGVGATAQPLTNDTVLHATLTALLIPLTTAANVAVDSAFATAVLTAFTALANAPTGTVKTEAT